MFKVSFIRNNKKDFQDFQDVFGDLVQFVLRLSLAVSCLKFFLTDFSSRNDAMYYNRARNDAMVDNIKC